jgi:hypothetical protein
VKQDIVREPVAGKRARRRVGTTGWKETVRKRTSRHDPKTAAQIAHRAPMRFARWAWWKWGGSLHVQWNPLRPVNFACEAVKHCHAMRAPSIANDWQEGDSLIEIPSPEATAVTDGIVLTFAPDGALYLWGIAIHRSVNEECTPNEDNLIAIIPATTTETHTYPDTPDAPGTYHYKFRAYEQTGKPGPISDDVFATIP